MRILQLIDSLEGGGAERMAVNYANGLLDYSSFSGLAVSRKTGILENEINPGVQKFYLNKKRKLDVMSILKLRQIVVQNKVEWIHAHSTSFFIACCVKIIYPKIKIAWHDHYGNSDFLNNRNSLALKIASLLFDRIIVVNDKLKVWAATHLYCKHILFIPNFADLPSTKNTTTLKGQKGKRIVCLANLRPQKNHSLLLEVARMLREKEPNWSFHLVGQDFNDTYSNQIQNKIKEYKLENHVYLYGSCQDVSGILDQCNIGVLTSLSEGLPVAIIEYGLKKLPVVATNVGDVNKLIIDEYSGLLINDHNIDDFFSKLKRIIDNATLANTLGYNLESIVLKEYSKKSVINIYLNFLNYV